MSYFPKISQNFCKNTPLRNIMTQTIQQKKCNQNLIALKIWDIKS